MEKVNLEFTPEAIGKIAHYAWIVNQTTENIGARRLMTVMEKLLEDISFTAPERNGEDIVIDADFVTEKLSNLVKDENISKYIL